MKYTVNGELTWFRIIGQSWYGNTLTRDIELNGYDIRELENLGLGLGESEKEAREVINQWLLASDVYDPQGFCNPDFSSVTDYDCQIKLSDGRYVSVDWEDDKNYAKYLERERSVDEFIDAMSVDEE
ncbi:MAG: hypothetical protein ACOVOQ_08340 [Flavobacterium sp.]|jgi:hypothetical protein